MAGQVHFSPKRYLNFPFHFFLQTSLNYELKYICTIKHFHRFFLVSEQKAKHTFINKWLLYYNHRL